MLSDLKVIFPGDSGAILAGLAAVGGADVRRTWAGDAGADLADELGDVAGPAEGEQGVHGLDGARGSGAVAEGVRVEGAHAESVRVGFADGREGGAALGVREVDERENQAGD
ncbi:MAG: hypothetical protein U0359_07095 [Byssovorax sp.]